VRTRGKSAGARLGALVTAAAVGLLGAACTGGDETRTGTGDGGTTPTTVVSDEIYDQQIDDMRTTSQRYPDDLCVLDTAAPRYMEVPGNDHQLRQSVAGYEIWLNAVAAVLPDPAASAFRSAAVSLAAAAEAQGFAPDFWESDEALAIVQSAEFVAAIDAVDAHVDANCVVDENITLSTG